MNLAVGDTAAFSAMESSERARAIFDDLARRCGGVAASRVLPNLDRSAIPVMDRQVNRMARFVFSALPQRGRILDVGCGSGEFYRRIPRWFRGSYVGVDLSTGMLGLFGRERRMTFPCRLVHGDIMSLSFDGGFAQVLCIGLMQCLNPPEYTEMMQRLAGLLAPRGVLAVDFPIRSMMRNGFKKAMDMAAWCGLAVTDVWSYGWLTRRVRRPWRLMMCLEELVQAAGVSRLPPIVGVMGNRLFLIARKR